MAQLGLAHQQSKPPLEKEKPVTGLAAAASASIEAKWGLPPSTLYCLALRFYQDNVGGAFPASAADRQKLQAASERAEAFGDKVSGDDPRAQFVQLLLAHCPLFASHLSTQHGGGNSDSGFESKGNDAEPKASLDEELKSKCTLEETHQEGAKDPPPVILAPELLTNTELKAFKERMQKQEGTVLRISCGEVATVRVPTRPDGQQLCWEFATDSYDLAFGLFFEWTDTPGNEVTVQVSESTDEEDELEDGVLEGTGVEEGRGDVERGSRRPPEPPLEEIEPLYRRNCHEVVHSGKHRFPGWGLYHIKFDNSYSLWRAKTLYYHVYYN